MKYRRHSRLALTLLAVPAISVLFGGCKPPPITCKTSTHSYAHQTVTPIYTKTWFIAYNEMRFCYNGFTVTSIEYNTNWTTPTTLPYTREDVTSTAYLLPLYPENVMSAFSESRHGISCLKIGGGFDVVLTQWALGDGRVFTDTSNVNSANDC